MAVDELDIQKKNAFLETFAKIGNITRSSQAIGVSRTMHYHWLETDEDYAERYREALETFKDSTRFEIFRRGLVGIDEPVVYQGQISKDANGNTVTVKKYSDTLLIVQAKMLGVFVDRQEHGGFGGGPIPVTFYIPDNRRDTKEPQVALPDNRREEQ